MNLNYIDKVIHKDEILLTLPQFFLSMTIVDFSCHATKKVILQVIFPVVSRLHSHLSLLHNSETSVYLCKPNVF